MALPAERLKTLIEAALFVAGRPLNVSELKSSVLADYPVTSRYVQLLLAELRQDYSERGVELKEVASGWRFRARAEFTPYLARLTPEKPPRYSRAVMETLANQLSNKFLHAPTAALKQAARDGDTALIRAAEQIFQLDSDAQP